MVLKMLKDKVGNNDYTLLFEAEVIKIYIK